MFKIVELIMCNVGIIQRAAVFQEYPFKVFKGGRQLPLDPQPVDPTCRIARHQGKGILTGLEYQLFIIGYILNTNRYVISFKGGEP